jgi:glycosyltransferase involved in cell wall biosynthesis
MAKVSVLVSLFRCQQFIEPYLAQVIRTEGLGEIEFLFLHNDPQPAETAVLERYLPLIPLGVHVPIPEREGLYATWNRGIRMASADYITVWNVDDIRFPGSIMEQARLLDENPGAALAYGDIYLSKVYGQQGDKVTNSPLWADDFKEFCRRYHMSCFQMWRKSVHQEIGYYDEQFRCSADFDFQIRLAMHYPLVKTKNPLGIYLEAQPHKLSSNGLQRYENNIIYSRYGALEHLDLPTLAKSFKLYKKERQQFYGQWVPWKESPPFDKAYQRKGMMVAVSNAPLSLAKLTAKRILRSLGFAKTRK